MKEMQFRPLGREDPLEDKMAIHSSILAWEAPWTEEPGGLRPIGLQRVGHKWGPERSTAPWCLGEIRIYSADELTKVLALDLGPGYSQRWLSASVSRPLETCFRCCIRWPLWTGCCRSRRCPCELEHPWATECDLSPLTSRRALLWGHRLHNCVRGLHLFRWLEQCRAPGWWETHHCWCWWLLLFIPGSLAFRVELAGRHSSLEQRLQVSLVLIIMSAEASDSFRFFAAFPL